MQALLMEFIGTFFLVFSAGMSGNPLAVGLTLMVVVYAGGHISGGHYNPAVTFAVWLRGKINTVKVLPYWLVQILGAFVAASAIAFLKKSFFLPSPSVTSTTMSAGLAEMIFTFGLCYVVLSVATSPKMEGSPAYGLAIGSTVAAGAFCVGSLSGGVFNPALALGPYLFNLVATGSLSSTIWIYLVFPLFGSLISAMAFLFIELNKVPSFTI